MYSDGMSFKYHSQLHFDVDIRVQQNFVAIWVIKWPYLEIFRLTTQECYSIPFSDIISTPSNDPLFLSTMLPEFKYA